MESDFLWCLGERPLAVGLRKWLRTDTCTLSTNSRMWVSAFFVELWRHRLGDPQRAHRSIHCASADGSMKSSKCSQLWTAWLSYLSAFGLVAGYFAIEGKNGRPDWDKGIRAHGSSNYMSILSKKGYSHGCHRLQNDRAVRLYGFVLSHRDHELIGNLNAPYRQRFFMKMKSTRSSCRVKGLSID